MADGLETGEKSAKQKKIHHEIRDLW